MGLTCALTLRKKYPDDKVLVIEEGVLPNGASTKNAGFACFGSVSELLDDLKTHTEQEVIDLVNRRIIGLDRLKKNLGVDTMAYQQLGGYEVFREEDSENYDECLESVSYINRLLQHTGLNRKDAFLLQENPFPFKKFKEKAIFNRFEGQIDTGLMMQALLRKAQLAGILLVNGLKVTKIEQKSNKIELFSDKTPSFVVKNAYVATNGFAASLLDEDIVPARAQVLITKPLKGLSVKGTFHLDKGYYYFRNVGDRILLGGGRNLDFEGETTSVMDCTPKIQGELERLLRQRILPGVDVTIDRRWSGIMGVGEKKRPVVRRIKDNLYCGIRLGGMGVAIGSLIGEELANLSES